MKAKLVGIFEFAAGGLAGATLVVFDDPTAQKFFYEGKDVFSTISVQGAPGVSQKQLVAALDKVIPSGTEALTGEELGKESKDLFDQLLGFMNTFLLVFAAIALVVGTFLIVNTFSILVAQRSRETRPVAGARRFAPPS